MSTHKGRHDHANYIDGCDSGEIQETPIARFGTSSDGSCFMSYRHTRDVIVIDSGQFIYRICRPCLNAVIDQIGARMLKSIGG